MKKKKPQITGDRILQELGAIGFARVTDYLRVDGDGITVRNTDELSGECAAAIASVENGSGGVKIKFYDKMKALELLGRVTGLFDGETVRETDNHLLDAILKSTSQPLDTEDLPELHENGEGSLGIPGTE